MREQHAAQAQQDPGGRAPNRPVTVLQHIVRTGQSLEFPFLAPVVDGLDDEFERDLEGLGHLEAVKRVDYGRRNDTDHRGHRITGDGVVDRQATDNLYSVRLQPDFFAGFPQGRGDGPGVPGRVAATREADLACVLCQMLRAPRQNDRHCVPVVDDGNENGRRAPSARALRRA